MTNTASRPGWRRWLIRISLGVLALLLVGIGAGIWAVRRPFPDVSGELAVPGLDAPVEVIRDTDGVPHIYASNSHDLWFAQGFVAAQDRFWQMDFWRHIGAGRLSELFGESQIETDSFLRTLGLTRAAERDLELLSEPARAALEDYASGVNAYLAGKSPGEISLEYALLGLQGVSETPEPWQPVHTLTWTRMMAWDLRSNMDAELDRAILSSSLPVSRVEQLYPPFPDDHPLIVPADERITGSPGDAPTAALPVFEDVADRLAAVAPVLGPASAELGSNSWVLSGARTIDGTPLLANDPHLGIQMPSIWYEVGLHCTVDTTACPYQLTGFSFAGAPGIVIGHNARIAWGFTNEGPDSMDLFVERVHPDDPDLYEVDGEWQEMETRIEVIDVAGGDPVELKVRETRHGPVISGVYGPVDDLDDDGNVQIPDRHAVALTWTALDGSRIVDTILGLGTARNWVEFRHAVSFWDIAAQNVVYADVDGHIGYQSTGRIPIRAAGDGRWPVPGWASEYEWEGYIPFDDLPRSFDPESGVIVTANQRITDGSYPYFIHEDTAYGYRADRIHELLGANGPADLEDLQRIQYDSADPSAPVIVDALLGVAADDERILTIQDALASFRADGHRMTADSAGAAAYAAVWRHLLAETFDELPEGREAGGNSRFFAVVERLLESPADPWWDRVDTPQGETRDDVLASAMGAAFDELTEILGDDAAEWRWGDLHTATFENQSFGQSGIGLIEMLFNRSAPAEVPGGSGIVNANGWSAPNGYEVVALPSMRMVVDLGDLGASRLMHTTGQSGHAYHRHYDDMIDRWTAGESHPMRWDRQQVEAEAADTLLLTPDD